MAKGLATTDHTWVLIDYRDETIYSRYEQTKAAYEYFRCTDCGIRKLITEGQPTYLISDDDIEAVV